MRALVLSLTNVDPIPDGSLLFTCRVDIAADATPGEYTLAADRMEGSTSAGGAIDAVGSGGTVRVIAPVEDSAPLNEGSGMQSSASGGCAIGASTTGGYAWMLLALPLVLLWRRTTCVPRAARLAIPPRA
jgi:hypothetical protein